MKQLQAAGRRLLSVVIVAALVLLSPGLGCYEAVAHVVCGQSVTAGASSRAVAPIRVVLSADLDIPRPDSIGAALFTQRLPSIQAPALREQAIPAAVSFRAALSAQRLPLTQTPVLREQAISDAVASVAHLAAETGRAAPVVSPVLLPNQLSLATTEEHLRGGMEQLAQAKTPIAQRQVLDGIYSHPSARPDRDPAVSAPESVRFFGPSLPAVQSPAVRSPPTAVPGLTSAAADTLDKKAMVGMFAQRTLSLIGFILVGMIFSHLAIAAVGNAGYGMLLVLGQVVATASSPLNGLLAKKFSARKFMIFTTAVRSIVILAIPVFCGFGVMHFVPLLIYSLLSGWISSAIMTSEGIYFKRYSGSLLGKLNALASVNYMSMQVGLGLILKMGHVVDRFPMLPFYLTAMLGLIGIIPIVWKMIPDEGAESTKVRAIALAVRMREQCGQALTSVRTHWKEAFIKAGDFLKTHWKETAISAVGLGLYLLTQSRLPIAGALLFCIFRTSGFKSFWSNRTLRGGLVFMMLAAVVGDPLQYLIMPLMAGSLAGAAGKSELLGMLMGAFFFGRLIANASQAKLGDIRLPLVGKVSGQLLLQLGVLGFVALWSWLSLFPGNWLALAGALAVAGLLMALSSRVTDAGWITFLGVGLAFIALPLLVWGNIPLLFTSVLMMGLFFGPASTALMGYLLKNIPQAEQEKMFGIVQAAYNAAVALGYGLFGLFPAAFPGMLLPIALVFVLIGGICMFAKKFMPGLPDKYFQGRDDSSPKP